MKDDEWFSGPPPSPGWWPASINKDPEAFRWYDPAGWWSEAAFSYQSAGRIARMARIKTALQKAVRWRHRPADWPERSRT